MNLKRLAYLVPVLVGCAWVTTASGTLVLEPVIGFFPGHGPSADTFPLYDPTYMNEATGEQVSLARNPGEIDKWSMGYPREESMLTFGMYNNTPTNITSLAMTIVGSSQELVEGVSWLVTPDPNVDARFGDANGDGRVGLSDIFGSITVSNDGRTITLSNGLIPTESHFTDYIFSYTTDGLPFTAAVEGSFDGVSVPEPATCTLLLAGLGVTWAIRRRRRGPSYWK